MKWHTIYWENDIDDGHERMHDVILACRDHDPNSYNFCRCPRLRSAFLEIDRPTVSEPELAVVIYKAMQNFYGNGKEVVTEFMLKHDEFIPIPYPDDDVWEDIKENPGAYFIKYLI